MTELITNLLPYLIGGLVMVAAVLLLIALQQLRRGRTGPYWRIRRTAGQRGGQLFLFSIALFTAAFVLALFSGLADAAYRRVNNILADDLETPRGVILPSITPSPRFSATPTATLTVTATATPTPTLTVPTQTLLPTETSTSTLTATPTATPTDTLTPTATFENVLLWTPPPSSRQPRAGARLTLATAAGEIGEDGSLVNAGRRFTAGIQRLYFQMDYRIMDAGIGWSRILFYEGVPVQGQSYLWSLDENGSTIFFFGDENGYPAGDYEIRLFIGQEVVSTFAFTLIPA